MDLWPLPGKADGWANGKRVLPHCASPPALLGPLTPAAFSMKIQSKLSKSQYPPLHSALRAASLCSAILEYMAALTARRVHQFRVA
jgi:hypothetical protein